MKLKYRENQTIGHVKKILMSKFDLPHLINFYDDTDHTKLNSSYLLKKGDKICIEKNKLNFHSSGNKYVVKIKRRSSNEKLLESFKKAMRKCFSVNSTDLVNISLIRLRNQKAEIHFQLCEEKSFLLVDFQANHSMLNNNRYKVQRFIGKSN